MISSIVQPIANNLIVKPSNRPVIPARADVLQAVDGTPLLSGRMHGKVPSSSSRRDMQPGRCPHFDEVDSYLDLTDASLFTAPQNTAVYGISFWVKFDTINNRQWFIGNTQTSTEKGFAISLEYGSGQGTNAIHMYVTNGSGVVIDYRTVDNTITAGAWHHVVITQNLASRKIYINGVDTALQTPTPYTGNLATGNASDAVQIGLVRGLTTLMLDGQLFDIRFYESELSASEVSQLYTLGADALPNKSTAIHLKLDENIPGIYPDSSGNNRHGTKTNWDEAANQYTGTDVPFSWPNEKGYTLSDGATYYRDSGPANLIPSGGVIPRLESDKTKCAAYLADNSRAALQYTGKNPGYAQAEQSNCGHFDGADDYVNVPDSADFDYGNALTVAVRAKNDSTGLAASQILLARANLTAVGQEFALYMNASEKLLFQINAGKTWTSTNVIPNIDSWHTYAVTFDGTTAGTKVYVDGIAVSGTWSASPDPITPLAVPLVIGSQLASGSPGNVWDGPICDARLYGRIWTASEALAYDNRESVDDTELRGHWPLAEGSGTTIYDASGNGNHGTATNISEATFWGTKQDAFHWNLAKGHSLYEHASLDDILVPYNSNGDTISITPPTGYTKTRDNPATTGHNGAESTLDFWPVNAPVKLPSDPVNLLSADSDIGDTAWTKTNLTVSVNAASGPNGETQADKLVSSAATQAMHIQQINTSVTSGKDYTFSCYVKADGIDFVQLTGTTGFPNNVANFDLINGTCSAGSIERVGDYWRIQFTITANSTSVTGRFILALASSLAHGRLGSITGDGSSGVLIWGCQFEQASEASHYVPSSFDPTPPKTLTFPASGQAINPFYFRKTTSGGNTTNLDRFAAYKRPLIGSKDDSARKFITEVSS